jgi:hypothetical protein
MSEQDRLRYNALDISCGPSRRESFSVSRSIIQALPVSLDCRQLQLPVRKHRQIQHRTRSVTARTAWLWPIWRSERTTPER